MSALLPFPSIGVFSDPLSLFKFKRVPNTAAHMTALSGP